MSFLGKKALNEENRAPIFFTLSSLWLSVVQLVAGVAVVHFIDPRDMGLWTSVSLAIPYSFIILAGIQNGLSRELPYHLGAGNEAMAQRLASTALFYTGVCCLAALAIGAGWASFLTWKGTNLKVVCAVLGVGCVVAFQFYQNYLFLTYRSKNAFLGLSLVQGWQGLFMLATLVFLPLGYAGLVLRAVIVAGAMTLAMHRARPLPVRPVWKMDSFLLLLGTGIPIFATDYLTNFARTVDRIALLRHGGVEQVGLYALAMSVYSGFAVLPQSIAHYVYPRMSHHYGRTSDPRLVWQIAWKTALIIVVAMIPVALVGSLLLPVGIKLVFPKYLAGTYAAQVTLFAAVAYGVTVTASALASLKAWRYLLAFQLSYALSLAVGPFIGLRFAASPLNGVAHGVLVANFIGALLALTITFAATHRKRAAPPARFRLSFGSDPPTSFVPATGREE